MLWLFLAFLGLFGFWVFQLLTYRRRRLLYSSWRRFVRWEFWPMGAFYPAVIIYILYLGIRYRCLTLFTAANPAIPHAGIAMMSKSEILQGLMKSPERVARFVTFDFKAEWGKRGLVLDAFMQAHGLSFPIVLKPDFGERGKGVGIMRSREEAMRYFRDCDERIIAQEYVQGEEYGVFYVRYPGEERGQITSLTEKRPTCVVGDGTRTLERLILDDERAVCMARFFLSKHLDRLQDIVPAGQKFVLSELGTHSRGSLFLDASAALTEELVVAFDELSQSYEGFFFGRYDVRVENRELLKQGRGFKAIELNGVVSEPTHMYDPKHGLLYAYKAMFAHWRHAFGVGAANRTLGAKPSTIKELSALVRSFREQGKREG